MLFGINTKNIYLFTECHEILFVLLTAIVGGHFRPHRWDFGTKWIRSLHIPEVHTQWIRGISQIIESGSQWIRCVYYYTKTRAEWL